MRKKVGFIGAGYMGYGIAKNILSNNFDLNVVKSIYNIVG